MPFQLKMLAPIAACLLLAGPATARDVADSVQPETATALAAKGAGKAVEGHRWMVSLANPLAAEAAADILREGGTAADAAIAAQLVLGLVEPQSSGLGGGAFIVYFDAASGKLTTLDGRETAPKAASEDLFLGAGGEPLKFFDAVVGGRSVGVPGTPALLSMLHKRFGKTEKRRLFHPAIQLANKGFAVSPRLAALIKRGAERLSRHEATRTYFLPGGKPLTAGTRLQNPAYGETLTRWLNEGDPAFYGGEIGEAIVATVRGFEANPGVLELGDLKSYAVKEREPVCQTYRGLDVCGMGPPSSGALTVGQILGMLNSHDLASMEPGAPDTWRKIGDAMRLAFADRGRYMADADFVKMPTQGLLDDAYLADRARLLSGPDRLEKASAGDPPWKEGRVDYGDGIALELPSTTHLSIVDGEGNALSMTSTIENGFGSRLMTNGFLLNNELTDFSFRPSRDGKPVANRVEPGKRPRSSMSPTIVMRDGKPHIVIGSPGGSRIIPYVASTLIAMIDWGMDVQSAITAPHVVNRFGTFDLEAGTAAEALQPGLEALGYKTQIRSLNSGLHGIVIDGDVLIGGADPRREGVVLTERR